MKFKKKKRGPTFCPYLDLTVLYQVVIKKPRGARRNIVNQSEEVICKESSEGFLPLS